MKACLHFVTCANTPPSTLCPSLFISLAFLHLRHSGPLLFSHILVFANAACYKVTMSCCCQNGHEQWLMSHRKGQSKREKESFVCLFVEFPFVCCHVIFSITCISYSMPYGKHKSHIKFCQVKACIPLWKISNIRYIVHCWI